MSCSKPRCSFRSHCSGPVLAQHLLRISPSQSPFWLGLGTEHNKATLEVRSKARPICSETWWFLTLDGHTRDPALHSSPSAGCRPEAAERPLPPVPEPQAAPQLFSRRTAPEALCRGLRASAISWAAGALHLRLLPAPPRSGCTRVSRGNGRVLRRVGLSSRAFYLGDTESQSGLGWKGP